MTGDSPRDRAARITWLIVTIILMWCCVFSQWRTQPHVTPSALFPVMVFSCIFLGQCLQLRRANAPHSGHADSPRSS